MTLPCYKKYKDSGTQWLEEIPSHWETQRVKWLFEIKKRIVGECGFDVLSITQQGIKIKDIESNDGQLSMDYSKYQLVEVGDFAMNHMDLLTGYVDISISEGVTSPDYRVFTIKNENTADSKYFLYLFQNGYKQKIFYAFGQGASQFGRWRLPTEQFNDFLMPFPPVSEQKSIVKYLDKETAKIDALIAEQDKLVEQLKSKMECLVLSAIVSNDTYETRLTNVVDIISRPVELVPNEIYTAVGLYNRGRGLFHKEPREMTEMGDSDFFWIEEGDLIISGQFAWEGAVAMATNNENQCVVSHRYPVLNGKSEVAITEYIYALLSTKHGDFLLNENSRGAAGRNRPLNINALMKEKIKIPAMSVQIKIADIVNKEREVRNAVKMQKKLLEERRSALISAAVTGKIDVRNFK